MSFLAKHFVEGDDGDAAETDVVLQGEPGTVDLAGVGLPAQLPHQLGASGSLLVEVPTLTGTNIFRQ